MFKYYKKLYEYCELQRKSNNRRLLREFTNFIENEGYDLSRMQEAMYGFVRTDWFTRKAKSTRTNYRRELEHFIAFLEEGRPFEQKLDIRSNIVEIQKDALQRREKFLQSLSEDTREVDSEYEAFLRKYDELTREDRQ